MKHGSTLLSGHFRNISILVLAGIIFRIYFLYTMNVNKIAFDGHQYYTAAYNLSQGNGFSIKEKEPFEPFYFREPALIYFYSFIIDICEIFQSKQAKFPVFTHEMTFDKLDPIHKSYFLVIKWIQLILQVLTIVLFYFIVSEQINRKSAFVCALFLSLYFPFAFITIDLMRETLVSFLLMLLTYCWLRYYRSRQIWLLICIGLLWGIATLTFQVYVILGGVFLVYLWFHESALQARFIKATVMLLVFILTISPWIIRVYQYYPDIRVSKTIGVSLTHEMMDYVGAIRKSDYYQKTKTGPYSIFYYKSASKQFRESFDGTYTRKADSINKSIGESLISKYKLRKLAISFANTFFISYTLERVKTLRDPFNPKNTFKIIY
jgi:hypothetical protein